MMDNTHGNNAGGGGPGPGGPGSGSGGAQHLARIHGTEEDRVNCPFYFKIGACRHGDRCSRTHHKPAFSPTVLLRHVYQHPVRVAELKAAERSLLGGGGAAAGETKIDRAQAVEDFLQFYENMYEELGKFGRLEALHVCDNLGDHMIGHVYAKFASEEEAADALQIMNGRYYDGRQMEVEFSPVTDFREARCRDFDEDTCARGGFCNFMHIKPVPHCLVRSLEQDCEFERRREEMERQRQRERDRRGRGGRRRRRGGGSDVSDSSDGDDSGDSDDGNKRGRQRPGRSRSGSRGRGGGGGGRVGRKRSRRSDSRSASRSRSRSGSRK